MGDGVSVCKFRDGLSTTSKNSLNIAKFFERKSMATKNCGVTGGGLDFYEGGGRVCALWFDWNGEGIQGAECD